MRHGFDATCLGLLVLMVSGCSPSGGGAVEDGGPPGPLGDVLRREDWESARLRVGTYRDGRVTYKEVRLSTREDLGRLAGVLRKARHIDKPATYEFDDNQAFEIRFSGDPEVTFRLFSPARFIALGGPGSREYYEIPQEDLADLFGSPKG